jgi:predicted Zn-dependent protease
MDGLGPDEYHVITRAQEHLNAGRSALARQEIEAISPLMQSDPAVLRVKWEIEASEGEWESALNIAKALYKILPESDWSSLLLANSLHALSRTNEAYDLLIQVVSKYPGEYMIPYRLACFACSQERFNEARSWLTTALQLAGSTRLRLVALDDPELRSIWHESPRQ